MKIVSDRHGCGEDYKVIDRVLDGFADSIKVIQAIDPRDEGASDVITVFGLNDPLDALRVFITAMWLPRWFTIPLDDLEISIEAQ